MADFRFLHLGVNYESGLSIERRNELEKVLSKAKDWLRYAPGCWLIYTSVSPLVWHTRLKQEVPWILGDSYLIIVVNTKEKSGWLRQSAWDWINKPRA